MKACSFVRRTDLDAPADFVFRWHENPGAFERLTPPWEPVRVVERHGTIRDGDRLVMRLGRPPFALHWVAEHMGYRAGEQFCDVQRSGPFAHWEHTHRIVVRTPTTCTLIDDIEYALPLGGLGRALGGAFTRARLDRMFRYRHTVTRQDIDAHWRSTRGGTAKILVSGASGLLGSGLSPFLTTGGHQVVPLGRSAVPGGLRWDPAGRVLEQSALEGLDAVVHLAGESIADGRWNPGKKRRIAQSRIEGTRLIADTVSRLEQRPKVLVCASAIGFYGDRGDEVLDESASRGSGFLSEVCVEWEKAAESARDCGIRVVHLRFGVVLTPQSGALGRVLLPFRLGAGGTLGDGKQCMSWIAIDDAIGAILHAITTDQLQGPVNVVAPTPVRNRDYAHTLGRVLGRPAIVPIPAFGARLAFGEMADELLLSSARVVPRRLVDTGYQFRFPNLEDALRHMLGK